jgi:hypothetical protein
MLESLTAQINYMGPKMKVQNINESYRKRNKCHVNKKSAMHYSQQNMQVMEDILLEF